MGLIKKIIYHLPMDNSYFARLPNARRLYLLSDTLFQSDYRVVDLQYFTVLRFTVCSILLRYEFVPQG